MKLMNTFGKAMAALAIAGLTIAPIASADRGDRDRDRRDRDRSPPRPVREPSPDPVQREREEAMRSDLTVLVQRIHPRADDFEIFEFFSQAGTVRDIRIIRDQRSGKSKGP